MKTILFLVLLPIAIQFGFASDYFPRKTPDRIVLTWETDPANSQAVTWRTDTSITQAKGQIVEAHNGPYFEKKTRTFSAITQKTSIDGVDANYHSVNFKNLQPNTLFSYRVGTEDNWSEWINFKTASNEESPFTFIYLGDAQNQLKSLWSRVVRKAYSHNPEASFILYSGDLVNKTHSDREWHEWFYGASFIHAMKPVLATPGNHEYDKNENGDQILDEHWDPTFSFPYNGPEGMKQSVYYTDYQGVRFISLNSQLINYVEKDRLAQAEWLENILSNNPNRWTIIFFHHPIYSSKEGRDNPEFRDLFKPLFDKYKVDLVLQGHDHTYGRGMNIPSKNENPFHTMYVVSVSGPKMYNLTTDRWMDRAGSNTQFYQIITIEENLLNFEAYMVNGELYDAFQLEKDENYNNRLINKIPDIPERTDLPAHYIERYSQEELDEYNKIYDKGYNKD
jgi:acid phosphatase type 7